jgi:hypothetical protein
VSGLTSNANLTGFKYGNIQTVGEQYPSVPISAATGSPQTVVLNQITSTSTVYNPTVNRQASNAISLNQIASTTNIYLPAVVQAGGTQTVTLDRIASTTQIYLPTISRQASKLISLNRLESTTSVYLPTVVQAAGPQTITLNRLNSTTQIYLSTIAQISNFVDTSDILNRYTGKRSESKEEEEIAAQLLKARQKRPQVERKVRKLRNWKKLIYEAIYGADTLEEVDAITTPPVPVDSPEIAAAILAEIKEQKALRKAEITLTIEGGQSNTPQFESQKQAIDAIKQLQQEILNRHAVAVEAAKQMEIQAFLQLQEAERKAEEFTRKRNNRIKRLKALMWLAKIDL